MKKPIPPNLVDLLFCFVQLLVRHSTSLNEAEPGSGRGSFRIRLVAGLRIDQRSPLVEMPGTYFGRNRISPVVASVKHAGFPFPTVGIAALHDEPFDHAVEKHSVVGARTAQSDKIVPVKRRIAIQLYGHVPLRWRPSRTQASTYPAACPHKPQKAVRSAKKAISFS